MCSAFKNILFLLACCTACFNILAAPASARTGMHHGGPDSPHNTTNGISCDSCHSLTSTDPKLILDDLDFGTNIDDTRYNSLCWSCHVSGGDAPYVRNHSSLNTSDRYGNWTVECWVCHSQHAQEEINLYPDALLYSGIADNVVVTGTTITVTDDEANWPTASDDNLVGMRIVPNTLDDTLRHWNYKIVSNTATTLTVERLSDTSDTSAFQINNTFGIYLGKLMPEYLRLVWITNPGEEKSGKPYPKLFRREGTNSYADGDGVYDGICEVCHTMTNHFRNDGSGPDPLHTNLSEQPVARTNCIRCHRHENGFAHSGGPGTGCGKCHGHDAGSNYDDDMMAEDGDGINPTVANHPGYGTAQSHSTHTESNVVFGSAYADDRKGPGIYCDTCHLIDSIPFFKSGTDANGDGRFDLNETDVCDACHSKGGTYDGIADPVIGAKKIWQAGAYVSTSDSTLQDGKEKWCAGCHDEEPSNSKADGLGVPAPNVIGAESGAYTYDAFGMGWGFYKTGHGLPADQTYPASGGIAPGAGATCAGCHDQALAHIDGEPRTYNDNNSTADSSDQYRDGYRLKLINGQNPMSIPKQGKTDPSLYRLCANCHTNTSAFTDSASTETNFRDGTNRHYYHMDANNERFTADWDSNRTSYTSLITCVTCHNVHGSTRLAMLRDGKLAQREPGIEIWYYNPAISVASSPPFPADLPLSASTGMLWEPSSSGNVCSACHGGTNEEIFNRGTPFQDTTLAPVLAWTEENGYISDGAAPDSAAPGSSFTFRINYTDANNDAPATVQVWIDADNDGTYESQFPMTGINGGDNTYLNGKIYSTTLVLTGNPGDIINYRFYAIEDKVTDPLEATGEPTGQSSITLISAPANDAPELSWAGGTCRPEGVSPRAGVTGTVFEFAVKYTDVNNEFSFIEVWVDQNDDGDFEDIAEKQAMTVDGGDGDYTNGESFITSLTLNYAGDGKLNYRFVASDGIDAATGEPTADHTVTVIQSGASLKTVCASGCDYTTIQAAVDAINGAHTVLVSAGTYNEKVYFNGANDNNTIVRSVCGPDDTIINAAGVTYGVQVAASTGSVVDGFGITGGTNGVYLNHSSASTNVTIENCKVYYNAGVGIYSGDYSSITVNNSEVYANTAGTGAGIYLMEGISSINDTIIRNNHATVNGGGVATGLWNNATFTNTTIKDNIADGSGGGFAQGSDSSTAAFYQSTIKGNTATTGSGGGLYIQGEGGTYGVSLTNSVVADNQAPSGGGIWQDGNLSAINCTIANNEATGTGGGGAIYANTGGRVTIRNSILWNNVASALISRHIAYLSSSTPTTISDSILNNDGGSTFNRYPYIVVQDGGALPTISGFVSGADPFFADAAGGDYHIQATSPAIDHANATYAPAGDIDGDARPQGGADDIGADEYRSATGNSAPSLAWTGENGYTEDGVNPDSGVSITNFVFRVDYVDPDNQAPVLIQLWFDVDDDGTYAADEKFALTEVDAGDTVYTDGKRYTGTMAFSAAGDSVFNYRFYATAGLEEATGEPTSEKTVTLTLPLVTFSGSTQATAGESGTAAITVQLSEVSGDEVTVPFTVNASSTAIGGGTDYDITASPVTIPAGSTTATITVTVATDSLDEDNETVVVNMGPPTNAILGAPTTHTVTITDDDDPPTVSFTSTSQPTAGETGTATITAQLSVFSGRSVTVPFTVNAASTADDPNDYTITASPLTITAGNTSADITVTVAEDFDTEGDETVIVDMGTPINATPGAITTHTLTITEDDIPIAVCGSNPAPFDKIQTTIADAGTIDGDTILVCAGTYPEQINFLGKDIRVRSAGGAAVTFLTGNGSNAPVVTFNSGETAGAVLDGFTIDNQAAQNTATRGISITGAGTLPTIRNCVITGNAVTGSGAGINSANSLTLSNVTFANNTASTSGGALYAALGFSITGSTFTNNQAATGGAVYNTGGVGNFYGANTFTGNVATGSGGNAGGALFSNARVININDAGSVFSGNSGTGSGGAVWVSAAFNISGATTFDGNGSSGTTSGGAIISRGGTINDATFTNNRAAGNGGAVFFVTTAGTINRSTFSGNSLTAASNGGAFYSTVGGNNINNCTFSGNSAGPGGTGNGGAIYTTVVPVNINYSTFYDNLATTAAAIWGGAIRNSIVANSSGALTLCTSSTDGGSNLHYNGTCVATFTTTDPLLSALADNGGPTPTMALQAGSPAVDTGISGTCLATDQRGVTRPVDGDGDLTATCDIGAYEYVP